MDSYEGGQSDPLSLHKYLYCHADPVNGIDPSGLKTVLVVRDEDWAWAKNAGAESAASHLRDGGWTIVNLTPLELMNYTPQFDGVIFAGHGDAQRSASTPVEAIQGCLRRTNSKLQVGIFLSCHSTDYAKPLLSSTYSTGDALFITYSGYGHNVVTRRWRVGRAIDAWLANPKRTERHFWNAGDQAVGVLVYDIVIPAATAVYNSLLQSMMMPTSMSGAPF